MFKCIFKLQNQPQFLIRNLQIIEGQLFLHKFSCRRPQPFFTFLHMINGLFHIFLHLSFLYQIYVNLHHLDNLARIWKFEPAWILKFVRLLPLIFCLFLLFFDHFLNIYLVFFYKNNWIAEHFFPLHFALELKKSNLIIWQLRTELLVIVPFFVVLDFGLTQVLSNNLISNFFILVQNQLKKLFLQLLLFFLTDILKVPTLQIHEGRSKEVFPDGQDKFLVVLHVGYVVLEEFLYDYHPILQAMELRA